MNLPDGSYRSKRTRQERTGGNPCNVSSGSWWPPSMLVSPEVVEIRKDGAAEGGVEKRMAIAHLPPVIAGQLPPVGGNFSSGSMLCIERRCARRLCATKYVGNIGNKWERPSLLPLRIGAAGRSRSRRRTGNMGEQLCCAVPRPRGILCSLARHLAAARPQGRSAAGRARAGPSTPRFPAAASLACSVSSLEYGLYAGGYEQSLENTAPVALAYAGVDGTTRASVPAAMMSGSGPRRVGAEERPP